MAVLDKKVREGSLRRESRVYNPRDFLEIDTASLFQRRVRGPLLTPLHQPPRFLSFTSAYRDSGFTGSTPGRTVAVCYRSHLVAQRI